MRQTVVVRYSTAFKQEVIRELECGRFETIEEARLHYGIPGTITIRGWLKRYGKTHLYPKVIRVEKPNERDQVKELKKQINQLHQVLGKKEAQLALGEAFLEIACEKMGIDVEEFKKKAGSVRPGKQDENS